MATTLLSRVYGSGVRDHVFFKLRFKVYSEFEQLPQSL